MTLNCLVVPNIEYLTAILVPGQIATRVNIFLLQKLTYNKRRGGHFEFTPCCAAMQFQPLQLVYLSSNKTLATKLLSNMIVETCGCM